MLSISTHLVRRGAELASAHFVRDHSDEHPHSAGWRDAMFMFSFLVLAVLCWSVEYTYGMVVATLAAVEDTHPDLYVRVDTVDTDVNKPTNQPEPETEMGTAPPPKPITSSLRTTIKHLRARVGYWSRFRGLSMFAVYSLTWSVLSALIPLSPVSFLGQFVVQSLICVILAPLQMAWVHIVISEPSSKRFYQRIIPSFRDWAKIAPAAAFQAILTAAAFFFPMAIASFAGWVEVSDDVPPMEAMCRVLAVGMIPGLLALLISIPARVVFIRVAASMLPEEDESIVPFDRSFGGAVSPAIMGGSGKLSLSDAWTTFDWPGRVRFVKVIAKTFAIQLALIVLGGLVLGGQMLLTGVDKVPDDIV